MNGKKAKVLRKLAALGVKSNENRNRSYHGVEHTVRKHELKDLLGKVTHRFQTATYELDAGARVMYNILKKNYLSKLRAA